uniref:Leucine rich repeat and sterile alpha motif containing 1 n=1 Tax=Plectus sambesii TaxID=2011161 RepID=A0A914WCS9_9BILA
MSFFKRKSSKAGQARLETQLHIARHAPDASIDISGCDLVNLPADIYSLCRVLRKQALLIDTNRLGTLKAGGDYAGLEKLGDVIRVIDAHDNDIRELPAAIGKLINLQVLNFENNKLAQLPIELGRLGALQTLNLKNNVLSELPTSMGDLRSLRSLDISRNNIRQLPLWFARLVSLETLILDAELMIDPPPGVCVQGTPSIMQYLCAKAGIDYRAPSTQVLSLLREPTESEPWDRRASVKSCSTSSTDLGDLALQYEKQKELKRQEQLRLTQQLLEQQSMQAALVADCNANRKELLDRLVEHQSNLDAKISSVQLRKDEEKRNLIDAMSHMEQHAQTLIKRILDMNKEYQSAERILEAEEQRRIADEERFKVKLEEYDRLRREEIQKAMADAMAQNFSLEELRSKHLKRKDQFAQDYLMADKQKTADVTQLLLAKDEQMRILFERLMADEQFQKEALMTLMEQRDAHTNRLNGQIDLIQQELAQLSLLERKQKDMRIANEQVCLDEERQALMALLMQLIEEKRKRSEELHKRLVEMEQSEENKRLDYWLVQYQKLLDSKPSALIEREAQLEPAVVKVLCRSAAENYMPAFARHRILAKQLPHLTEQDLQKLGIYEVGLRKAILDNIAAYFADVANEDKKNAKKETTVDGKAATVAQSSELEPTASAPSAIVARYEAECVVCLAAQVALVFVPCGHVCVCVDCGTTLTECPLCRAAIMEKIDLYASNPSAPLVE